MEDAQSLDMQSSGMMEMEELLLLKSIQQMMSMFETFLIYNPSLSLTSQHLLKGNYSDSKFELSTLNHSMTQYLQVST